MQAEDEEVRRILKKKRELHENKSFGERLMREEEIEEKRRIDEEMKKLSQREEIIRLEMEQMKIEKALMELRMRFKESFTEVCRLSKRIFSKIWMSIILKIIVAGSKAESEGWAQGIVEWIWDVEGKDEWREERERGDICYSDQSRKYFWLQNAERKISDAANNEQAREEETDQQRVSLDSEIRANLVSFRIELLSPATEAISRSSKWYTSKFI